MDEIQKAAGLFDYIKDIVDEDRDRAKGQFYLTGSQSLRLMKNVADSLAGRVGVIKLMGLSLRELTGCGRPGVSLRSDVAGQPGVAGEPGVAGYRDPFVPAPWPGEAGGRPMAPDWPITPARWDYDSLTACIHKGFFPELHETGSDLRDWADFHSSYLQTYLEKDIRDILNIQDESAFIKFVKAAASLTGNMLNLKTMADICGKDVKTVGAWLSVLESCGLVYLLEPYKNNFNKRLIKTPKLYFLDTGLACWLLGWNTPEQLVNGAMWGHIFESFVFAEILKSYYNDGIVKPPLYYYRDTDKNEIDLVIAEGDTLYHVEIKPTANPAQSMVKSFRCLRNFPDKTVGTGALICLAREILPLTEGVWILPAGMI